ncbi:MAG: TIGR03545 family protein [Bacteroidota bacterium]
MRTKFLYIVVVPFLVFLALLYFFLDGWVESGLELAGESFVGAKVEIDDLHLTFVPVGMELARLQVADLNDPWTNAFETGRIAFAMDFGQLLRNKYIIENIEVNEFILGTKRTSDGSLEHEPEPVSAVESDGSAPSLSAQAQSIADEKKRSTPMFDLTKLRAQLNIDSLLDARNLRSVQHLDTLERQIRRASQEWESALSEIEQSRERIKDIEERVKAINVNELKSLDKVVQALNNANEAQKGIREVAGTLNARKQSVTEGVNQLTASVRSIDDIVRQDLQRLLDAARLPGVDMGGLAELLLSKDILEKANDYLRWVDFAKQNIRNATSTPANEKPPRLQGQTIHFPSDDAYPKLWMKKINVSGGTDQQRNPNYFYAQGKILNITSDQKITGLPMTVDLAAQQGRGTDATFTASIDRTQEVSVDAYGATLSGVPIAAMELGRSDFLPSKITDANAAFSVQATVPGSQFDATAQIDFRGITVEFGRETRNTVERLVREVLASISAFTVKLHLWKTDDKLDVAFETDLDNILAARVKKVIGDEVTRIRNDLKAKLDEKVREKRAQVEELFNQKRAEVTTRLQTYEDQIKEKLALVDNKKAELENEKKKQEEALKKKAGDALKGVFKKN